MIKYAESDNLTHVSTSSTAIEKIKNFSKVVVVAGSLASLSGPATASTFSVNIQDLTSARSPGRVIPYKRESSFGQHEEISVSSDVMEIRRLAAFTWEEIAQIFDVSPKTVHNWISGKVVNAKNEQRISRVLATLKRVYKGQSSLTRKALFDSGADGKIPFDLIKNQDFEEVEQRLGINDTSSDISLSPISVTALSERRPQNPMSLLDTYPDVQVKTRKSKARFVRPPSKKE